MRQSVSALAKRAYRRVPSARLQSAPTGSFRQRAYRFVPSARLKSAFTGSFHQRACKTRLPARLDSGLCQCHDIFFHNFLRVLIRRGLHQFLNFR